MNDYQSQPIDNKADEEILITVLDNKLRKVQWWRKVKFA